jgi:hypothetical protein
VPHRQNLGPLASFNLAWKPIGEPFMSILEDDNWWEPEFLKEMMRVMNAHSAVDLAWANMMRWRERPGNDWQAEGTVWEKRDQSLQFFCETQPRQMMEPLHSNGAMLVRTRGRHMIPYPDSLPFFMIEASRERWIRGPLLLHRKPLANFGLTLATGASGGSSRKDRWPGAPGRGLSPEERSISGFPRASVALQMVERQVRTAINHRWWSALPSNWGRRRAAVCRYRS